MRRFGGVWEVTVPVTNEELALAFQQGDTHAGEELLRNVEGLIRHQASKMCQDDSLLEDLLQEGRAAVMEAAEKFDPGRGALFTTYALPLIRAAMVEYLAKADSPVSFPLSRYVQLRKIGKAVSANEKEHDQLAKICQMLGVSLRVAQALRKEYLSFRSDPIPLKDLDLMSGDLTSDPAYVYEQRLLFQGIVAALDELSSRERNLILRYLGLEGKAITFQELAILFNYNGPSSAKKAYHRAVEKLKAVLWEGRYGQYRRARRLVDRAMQDAGKE